MPKFPGVLQNNNPNAPSLDLNDLQVKGVGIFADATDRDALDANIQTEGYLAIMKDDSTVRLYNGGGWASAANWEVISGKITIMDGDGTPSGNISTLIFPDGNLTVAGDTGVLNFNGLATSAQVSALQGEVDSIETSLGLTVDGNPPSSTAGDFLISDGTNFGVSVYSLPVADGTVGQYVQTDGSGQLSFATISATLEGLTDTPSGYGTAGQVLITNGTDGFTFGSGSPWVSDTNGITYTAGNVGIGAASSSNKDLIVGNNIDLLGGEMRFLGVSDGIKLQAAYNTTAGVGIGYQALASGGAGSVAIGNRLKSPNNGTVVLGYSAQQMAYTAADPRAVHIGHSAGMTATTANDTVAIGNNPLSSLTTGSGNVAIGRTAGSAITTESYNTFIGYEAGRTNTGSSNVFIGKEAGEFETGSNKLYISNANTTTPLIYGEFDTPLLKINGQLHIGDITGTGYAFPAATGTNGQFLQVDSNGDLGFITLQGSPWEEVSGTTTDIKYEDGSVGVKDSATLYETATGTQASTVRTRHGSTFPGNQNLLHLHEGRLGLTTIDSSSNVDLIKLDNGHHSAASGGSIGLKGYGMYVQAQHQLDFRVGNDEIQDFRITNIGNWGTHGASLSSSGLFLPGGLIGSGADLDIKMAGGLKFYNHTSTEFYGVKPIGFAGDLGVQLGAFQSGLFASFRSSDQNTAASYGYLGINVNTPTATGPAFEVSSSYGRFNDGLHVDGQLLVNGGGIFTGKYQTEAAAEAGSQSTDVTSNTVFVEHYYTKGQDGDGYGSSTYTGSGTRRMYFSSKFNADPTKIDSNDNPEGWYAIDLGPIFYHSTTGAAHDVYNFPSNSDQYLSQQIENTTSAFKTELFRQLNSNRNINSDFCTIAVAIIPTKFTITTTASNEVFTLNLNDTSITASMYALADVDWGDSSSTSFSHYIDGPSTDGGPIPNLDGVAMTSTSSNTASIWNHTYASAGTYTITINGPVGGLTFQNNTQVTEINFGNQARFNARAFENASSLSTFTGRMLHYPSSTRLGSGGYERMLSEALSKLTSLGANQDLDEWFSPYDPVESDFIFGNGTDFPVANPDTIKVGKYIKARSLSLRGFNTGNLPSWSGAMPGINFDFSGMPKITFSAKTFAGDRLPIIEGKEPDADCAISSREAFDGVIRFDLGKSIDQLTKNGVYATNGYDGIYPQVFWRVFRNGRKHTSLGSWKIGIGANNTNLGNFFQGFQIDNDGDFVPFPIVGGVTKLAGGYDITSLNYMVGSNMDTDISGLQSISDRFTNLTSFTAYATQFTGRGVEKMDTRNVTTLSAAFTSNNNFNGDVTNWDVSNVTSLSNTFKNCHKFNRDISGWDVSNVTNMYMTFDYAVKFNADISGWDVSNVTTMKNMFSGDIYSNELSAGFNQDISGWDVSNVTNMHQMFRGNHGFNQPIGSWDVSSVTDMSQMFTSRYGRNPVFNQDLSAWDMSNVTTIQSIFSNAYGMSPENIGASSAWNITSNCIHIGTAYSATGDGNLTDFSGWDVSSVTNMSGFISYNSGFSVGFDNWDTSSCTAMTSFARFGYDKIKPGSESEKIAISGYTGTSNQITLATAASNNFVVGENVYLWNGASGRENGALITAISSDRLTLTVSITAEDFVDTSSHASPGMSTNPNVESWDVSNVTAMNVAFTGCSLDRDLSAWNLSSISNISSFADRMTHSKARASLIGWANNSNTNTGVNAAGLFGNRSWSQSAYPAAKAAYDTLVDSVANGGKAWTITQITWTA